MPGIKFSSVVAGCAFDMKEEDLKWMAVLAEVSFLE
jgi:hypothetical protein